VNSDMALVDDEKGAGDIDRVIEMLGHAIIQ